ncbi:hypothetical protein [Candidatus Parabeggiatoa sp. HSG14]|uniref:hypothetical protein n=1 Tax=Candidatus Parabeggiatoa sp. HSG14 TaxID=3055593 RepID=UPI0025A89853|nr:hypothetical protein [Thiotrichales bacterium HSG14]
MEQEMEQEMDKQKLEPVGKLKSELRVALQESSKPLKLLLKELEGNEHDDARVIRPTLIALKEELEELENRANFLDLPNQARCSILAKRLGATGTATDDSNIFTLRFDENFPIGLNRCLLYFSPTNWAIPDVIAHLQNNDEMAFEIIIVISLDLTQQKALYPYRKYTTTLWVIPTLSELTTLLLSSNSIPTFVELLTTQLKITQISPYQTAGAVQKDTIFFGRTQILAHILNRAPTNYLIIGGRQLGKSSLLKYIERRYQNNPKVECHYLVLFDHLLQPSLTKALKLPKDTDLTTLLDNLANVSEGQRRLFLIDESDLFIRDEMTKGYPILSQFRSLSEEGRCHFIFAGFWYLYEATVLDYHSPIKNFGEAVFVGELEEEACRELATKPMEMLGINYAFEELVEHILEQTGQQANLIAIVCHTLLKKLEKEEFTLEQENVTNALHSRAVEETLGAWARLTGDEQASLLDRLIVYITVEKGIFTLNEIMDQLDEYLYDYTGDQLKQSLNRLRLAFIIRQEEKFYRYCVPLFRQMLMKQDLTALLRAEGVKKR